MKKSGPIITPNDVNVNNADIVMENIAMIFGMSDEPDNSTMCLVKAMHYGIEAIRELRKIKARESK